MSEYDIKVSKDELVELLSKNAGLGDLLSSVLNQILEAQMTEHLGAERYEQQDERSGYRNGHRVRKLYTRVGPLCQRQ